MSVASMTDVCFSRKNSDILCGINLDLQESDITALVGPNGAGKTTTIRCLTGLLMPQKGEVRLFGNVLNGLNSTERADLRRRIGVQSDSQPYLNLSGHENIMLFGLLHGLGRESAKTRTNEIIELLGLGDAAKDRVGQYSKGMRQKVLLGASIVSHPDLLILDEPSSGLDPQASADLMTYIDRISKEFGASILLSSHRLEEVEKWATNVSFISRGRTVASGSLEDLRQNWGEQAELTLVFNNEASFVKVKGDLLATLPDISLAKGDNDGANSQNGYFEVVISSIGKEYIPMVNKVASASEGLLFSYANKAKFEDIYFDIMGRKGEI